MSSVLSFPDRGKWGDAGYRGNCSGHVYGALFDDLQPSTFCDAMMGSGTSIEVAQERGIQAWGLDLRLGFNALRDSIVGAIGQEVDLVLTHPPYGRLLQYSGAGNVWGTEAHPDDLSWCKDDVDFHDKLQRVLLNQREATRPGGHYGTIIGDRRERGQYVSYQAEAIARMPADELVAVLIKQQHNCMSDARRYARMQYPRITHEYILLWKRRQRSTFELLRGMAVTSDQRLKATWKAIVHMAMVKAGGSATLSQLYELVHRAASNRCTENEHWKAKVRQTLQLAQDLFVSDSRGHWKLAPSQSVS